MSITTKKGCYLVDAAGMRLTWNAAELTFSVRRGRQTWEFAPPDDDALCCRTTRDITLSPTRAACIETEPFANGVLEGISCRLSGFAGLPRKSSLTLNLIVAIEIPTGDLVVTVDGSEKGLSFERLAWPGPVLFRRAAEQETAIPIMQGALIPGGWKEEIRRQYFPANGRWLYMPWWAQRRGNAGYMAIMETDADAGCYFDHPAGGPTVAGPYWQGSLGRISYPRTVRYTFFDRCDYVTFCKRYRDHLRRQGRFVSLRQKIEGRPVLRRLIGCPVVHTNTVVHIHPTSQYYDKDHPEKNDVCTKFRTRADQLRALRAKGVKRAYVHLDGWGVHGYDSQHPDTVPANREAGGWKGLRHLAETCHEMGYLLALHDQYRDYFHNAPSYDPANAICDADGNVPYEAIWYGGPQSILCTRFAPAYLLRNHLAVRRHGVKVDGTYLDVFAVVPPDECFNPAHRMTRSECLKLRAECFAIIRELEGIVSSEEPVDYAMEHLDLVHHGPYAITEWLIGRKIDFPCAPLWNLVYHDALFLPWNASDAPGGLGVSSTHRPVAHAALHGAMPYLNIEPTAREIARVKRLCRLHEKVALEEMVGHEFLNEQKTRQRAVYGDGTVVTADLLAGTWKTRRE